MIIVNNKKGKKMRILILMLGYFISSQVSAGLITYASDPSLSGASVINFNSETTGSFTSRTFNDDVTLSTTSGFLNVETTHSGLFGSSGAYIGNPLGNNFEINFTNSVSAFGFSWGAANMSWVMSLYDTSNTLIETNNIIGQVGNYNGFIGATNTGISKVTMTTAYFDYIILDNFRYVTDSVSVSEPTTTMMLVVGLIALGFARKKVKK